MGQAAARRSTSLIVALAAGLVGTAMLPAAAQTPAPGPAKAPPRAIRPSLDCHSDASTAADFNGDGTDDVVLGAPFDDLFDNEDVGSINVVYGTEGDDGGLDSTGDQLFSPGSAGLPAFKWVFGAGRLFGKGLAAGDFNNDGFADLAVGAPGTPVDDTKERPAVNVGAVYVLYGSSSGLSTRFSQAIHQNRAGMPGMNEAGDSFGWTLGAGDFNGDGADDLAIGAPGEDIDRTRDAGAVWIVYGKTGARNVGGGLSATSAPVAPQILVQGRSGLLELAETGDMFGLALASGNFNGDSIGGNPIDDLAVGVPQEDIGIRADTGGVQVLYGSSAGLTSNNQFWHQGVPGVEGANETGDLYGCALAAGSFSGLRFGEAPNLIDVDALAIGVPGEDVSQRDQGGVNVIYPGSRGEGLTPAAGPAGPGDDARGDQFFIVHPGLGDLGEAPQAGARFGQSLNAQNLNPVVRPGRQPVIDPAWELAVGAPGAAGGGKVFFIGGVEGDGLRDLPDNTYVLDQNTFGTHRAGEAGDEFGRTVVFGDHNDDGNLDAVIGAPRDSSCGELNETGEFLSIGPAVPLSADAVPRAGAALALFGDGSEIGPTNGPLLHLTPPGLGNWSLTRCDYIVEQTDLYGLEGEPQADAELSHTAAGL